MGEGRVVYLLRHADGAAEQIRTLAPAPLEPVGTVDEQDQQHEGWLHSRRDND